MSKGWKIPLELLSSDTSQLIDGEYIYFEYTVAMCGHHHNNNYNTVVQYLY